MHAADAVVSPFIMIPTSRSMLRTGECVRLAIAPMLVAVPEYRDRCSAILYDPTDLGAFHSALCPSYPNDRDAMGRSLLIGPFPPATITSSARTEKSSDP